MNVIHRRAAVREYPSDSLCSGLTAGNMGNSAPSHLRNGKITLRFLRMAAGLTAAMLLVSTGLFGQAVAVSEVSGTVADPSGKLIVAANVTMTEVSTRSPHATATDADGHYLLTNLPPGAYTLEVKAPGFKDYRQSGIVLEVAHNISINVALSVGSVTETIEVTANADMVETKDSAINQTMDPVKITELPLNGRNLTQLLSLTGGGTTAPGGDLVGS